MPEAAKIRRLLPPEAVCDRGAKDKLLWAIPEDAAFLCVWSDPISGDTYSVTSDGITGMQIDHLTMALIRRGVKERA